MMSRAVFSRLPGNGLAKETRYVSDTETQRVIILAGRDGASAGLMDMCEALDIETVTVSSHHDLPLRLHHARPMAVISELDPQSLACCAALRSIAAYDQDTPVLLVSGNDPVVLGTIDAAQELWKLSGLCLLPATPGPAELIAFLFHAGRQSGTGRLVPLG